MSIAMHQMGTLASGRWPILADLSCLQLSAKKIGEDSISQDCIDLLADAYSYCCNSPQRVAAVRNQQIASDIAQLKLLKLSEVSDFLNALLSTIFLHNTANTADWLVCNVSGVGGIQFLAEFCVVHLRCE